MLVILPVRARQGVDLQEARLAFLRTHTDACYLSREQPLGTRHTVLHVHRGHVRIRPLLEIHRDRGRAAVCSRGRHVDHVLHAVDVLFERHDDALLHRLGVRAGIGRRDHHGGRGDVRILLHGQREERDQPHDDDQDRDRHGQHGPLDKYVSLHLVYCTCVPSRISPAPSAMITSPASRPLSTTYSCPSFRGETVMSVETALPSTTL